MSETFPRVGSALLVWDEANRILLGQRNKDPHRGAWIIPGGKIHAFESIAQAAAREIEEETGLRVDVGNQFAVHEIISPPDEHRIVIYSRGKLLEGTPRASDDLSAVKWFSIDELGDVLLTPLVQKVLEDAGLLRRDVEPLPCPEVQMSLFGGTTGPVPAIPPVARQTLADSGQVEDNVAAVLSPHTQMSLFEDIVPVRRKTPQTCLRALVQFIGATVRWLSRRSFLSERRGRPLPIPLAGASEDSPLTARRDTRPRRKKRTVIRSGVLFDMRAAT